MSRLLSGRRPSSATPVALRKPQNQRVQSVDPQNAVANGSTVPSSHAPQRSAGSPANPYANSWLEKRVKVFIEKLEQKLPCNSGLALSAIECDQVMEQVVGGLVKLTASSPDYIVWNLCLALEKLPKRAFSDGTLPEDVLDSQLYILKTLTQVLNARQPVPGPLTDIDESSSSGMYSGPSTSEHSNVPTSPSRLNHANSQARLQRIHFIGRSGSSIRSDATSSSWNEPAPLEDATVGFALNLMTTFLSEEGINSTGGAGSELYPWHAAEWESALSAPFRTQKRRKGNVSGKKSSEEKTREKAFADDTNGHSASMDATGSGDILHDPSDASDKNRPEEAGPTWGVDTGSQYTMYAHEYTRDEALHGNYFASVPVLIRKYAGRVVYNISASNWSVVLTRIKTRLKSIADRNHRITSPNVSHVPLPPTSPASQTRPLIDGWRSSKQPTVNTDSQTVGSLTFRPDKSDHQDLKILSLCLLDRTRLLSVLQEYASVFREMSIAAQEVTCLAMRAAILNWAANFPKEYCELWLTNIQAPSTPALFSNALSSVGLGGASSHGDGFGDHGRKRRIMDGFPERMFDVLHEFNKENIRRPGSLYPILATLIAISPERFDAAIEALDGAVKVSKKNNFLAVLNQSFTTSAWTPIQELSAFAYLDLARLAFIIEPSGPGEDGPSFRNFGPHFARNLKIFLLHPSTPRKAFFESTDPIDVNFHAYCIAAIFRFYPEETLEDLIQVGLEPERSQAVKLCVVKALVLLVIEAPKYPWQPNLDFIYPTVTPRTRSIFRSIASGKLEAVNGVDRSPSPFPICKSLAANRSSDINLANVIDEGLRLLVQIETLFLLEPWFWLYETTTEDHQDMMRQVSQVLEPHRDKRKQASVVMTLGAMFTRSLNMHTSASYYKEAMDYLRASAPGSIVSSAYVLLSAIGDHELLRMGVNTMHTMLMQLVEGSPHDQDNSWRFSPELMTIMPVVELSLWITTPSPQMDLATTAQTCLRLLSLLERDPAAGPPKWLTNADFSERMEVIEDLGDENEVYVGRMAHHKRVRKHAAMIKSEVPIHIKAFQETAFRFSRLTERVTADDPKLATQSDWHEWQNIMYLLCAGGRSWIEEKVVPFPEQLLPILPSRLRVDAHPADMMKQFIADIASFLCSPNLTIREYAKRALGQELNPRLMPILYDQFNIDLPGYLAVRHPGGLPTSLLFLEQCLVILRENFERVDGLKMICRHDAADNAISIGLFVNRLPSEDEQTLRLRSQYCAAVEFFLLKRHYFAIRQENEFRNRLVDLLVEWIDQQTVKRSSRGEDSRTKYQRTAWDAYLTTLKLFVFAAETMRVHSTEDTVPGSDPSQPISRKLHRFVTSLVNCLGPVAERDLSDDTPGFDHSSRKSASMHDNEDQIYEHVVSGIVHLLTNNSECCKNLCISRCYDKDIRLRVVFIKAFTRVLNLGTKFDQPQSTVPTKVPDTLCEVVRESQMVTMALVRACPSNEVENLVPVMMHIFNTRHALLNLLKHLIHREAIETASSSQLFRDNTLCSRMLSAFARQHGFAYLRRILDPLFNNMTDTPDDCSFELEPSKLPAGESIEKNVQTIEFITQAFIDVLAASIPDLPLIIREVCRYIAEIVSDLWPGSKFDSIGAFIFLRFINPAIVAPETVGFDPKMHSLRARRGLLLIAKIINSMSSNALFSKEPHLVVLNPFLQKNGRVVAKYITGVHTGLPHLQESDDQGVNSGPDATDSLILHQFVQTYAEKIGKELLGQTDIAVENHSRFANGKDAWDLICTQLVDAGVAQELPPTLTNECAAQHEPYQQFMRRTCDRNTDALKDIFFLHPAAGGHVFIMTLAKINIDVVDFELLLYLIFKTLAVPTAKDIDFDIIFDFTSFTARSRMPNTWLRLAQELMPSDVRQRWRSAFILNAGCVAQSFLRNILYLFANSEAARTVHVVSSITELRRHFPNYPFLMASSVPASLECKVRTFDPVYYQIEGQPWACIALHVGAGYLRFVSAKAEDLSTTLSCRPVEVIYLREVDDVQKCSNERHIVLRRSRRGPSITLEHADRETLMKSIQTAKQRSAFAEPLLPGSQTSDTSAMLLAIGLLHACHNVEFVRTAANELLTAGCAYLGLPFDALIPWRGNYIPSHSLTFIVNFSDRISNYAPQMALDFILEWSVGYTNACSYQKTICLYYLMPWIRLLGSFIDPNSVRFDLAKVRECIRFLVDITVQDSEASASIHATIWRELAKSSADLLDIVLDELIRVAIDSGSSSRRCDLVADTLVSITCVHTRTRVITELRSTLTRACSNPTRSLMETDEWMRITVLSRLVQVAGHSPRLLLLNQLRAAELAHLVTMLAATGSLSMRISIHGMTINLLQSLHMARFEDEAVAAQIRQMLDDLATQKFLNLFGLERHHPSSEITLAESTSNSISVASLESLTEFLVRALDVGASSVGLSNTWKARWSSQVFSLIFRPSFCGQFRGFTILTKLADSKIEEHAFRDILLVFKRNVLSPIQDDNASAALLRCLRMTVPGLSSKSRYLDSSFWLAVSILQRGHTPLYTEAAQLLRTSVETMDEYGLFSHPSLTHDNTMAAVLMDAREPLSAASNRLDELSELSFETDFGFALTAVLWHGVRVRSDLETLADVLKAITKVSIRAANPKAERRRYLDGTSMPLFLGLAPRLDKSTYGRFLEEDCYIADPFRGLPETHNEYTIDMDVLGIFDLKSALLAVSVLLSLDTSYFVGGREKENIYLLLAEFVRVCPDLFGSAMRHILDFLPEDFLSHKMDTLFSYPASQAHLQAITSCFDAIMSRALYTSPNGTPHTSSTSLGHDASHHPLINMDDFLSRDGTYLEMLSDIGMYGLLEPARHHGHAAEQQNDTQKQADLAACVGHLIQLITSEPTDEGSN